MKKIKAALISNGIQGLDALYQNNEIIEYEILEIDKNFNPSLEKYDLFIAPNGTDHIALYRIKDKIRDFLDKGKVVMCFDGWFTDWIPGNRWVMDNSKKTIDIRYKVKNDPWGICKNFSAEELTFVYGISGWWSCGYIEPANEAIVVLEDTWNRPLVVVDNTSTKGWMVLSASGPLADIPYEEDLNNKAYQAMTDLYRSILEFVQKKI